MCIRDRCKAGKPIRPADANASSPHSTAPAPTAPRSAPRASPAPPGSTAASSTATATCTRKSTPSRPPRPPPATGSPRRSPGPRCKSTCSPPAIAPYGSPAVSGNWKQTRLSEALGEQAWHESGLGVPVDLDALNQKISHLEQQTVELRLQLAERDQDLAAARAANRELIAQLNTAAPRR